MDSTGKKTVVVAMSGGVDSSVAAALMKREGYDVIGVTMCFSIPGSPAGRPLCCGPEAIADAKRVAGIIGIPHYVLDFNEELKTKVVEDFFSEYRRGRTPNPCIRCNEFLKFDSLLKKAIAFGGEKLVTGHYARITGGESPSLAKACDGYKDQTYFLYRVTREQLASISFPLGEFTKEKVRELAAEFALPVAAKPDSQEVCFIPGKDELDALRLQAAPEQGPGPIVNMSGSVIGTHNGIALYTVGQRRGLGVAAERPLYVASIDVVTNTVVAGFWEEVHRREFTVTDTVFINGKPGNEFRCKTRLRHSHREADSTVTVVSDGCKVLFDEPQFAITPGQSAVFYDGGIVLGGGIIERVLG